MKKIASIFVVISMVFFALSPMFGASAVDSTTTTNLTQQQFDDLGDSLLSGLTPSMLIDMNMQTTRAPSKGTIADITDGDLSTVCFYQAMYKHANPTSVSYL